MSSHPNCGRFLQAAEDSSSQVPPSSPRQSHRSTGSFPSSVYLLGFDPPSPTTAQQPSPRYGPVFFCLHDHSREFSDERSFKKHEAEHRRDAVCIPCNWHGKRNYVHDNKNPPCGGKADFVLIRAWSCGWCGEYYETLEDLSRWLDHAVEHIWAGDCKANYNEQNPPAVDNGGFDNVFNDDEHGDNDPMKPHDDDPEHVHDKDENGTTMGGDDDLEGSLNDDADDLTEADEEDLGYFRDDDESGMTLDNGHGFGDLPSNNLTAANAGVSANTFAYNHDSVAIDGGDCGNFQNEHNAVHPTLREGSNQYPLEDHFFGPQTANTFFDPENDLASLADSLATFQPREGREAFIDHFDDAYHNDTNIVSTFLEDPPIDFESGNHGDFRTGVLDNDSVSPQHPHTPESSYYHLTSSSSIGESSYTALTIFSQAFPSSAQKPIDDMSSEPGWNVDTWKQDLSSDTEPNEG